LGFDFRFFTGSDRWLGHGCSPFEDFSIGKTSKIGNLCTNASLLPNKKCKYKLTLWMSGTTKAVLKGKMYTDKNYSKGKIKGKTNGQIWSGKYKMYKNSSTSGTTSLY
jgi:hypothetical protein